MDAYGDPSIQTDLNNFCNYYGIPTTTVKILGTSTVNNGWGLETALDVEWAHAIAPNATIILSVAPTASTDDLLAAVDAAVAAGATVVSMSWGAQEAAGIDAYETHFQVPGVTFVASSGDSAELVAPFEVEWPASSPNVVSVGGTTLYLDASGNRLPSFTETAWSSSGGGISAVFAVPAWQSSWQATGWRTVPDVSYVADPNTGVGVAYGRYLYEVGGTSVGAPQWSALIALADQSLSSKLSGNAKLYSAAGTAPDINANNFLDIVSGSDGTDGDDTAVTGYDLVTGLGSPVASNLVYALAPPTPDFTVAVSPGSETVAPNATASYTVSISPSGGFSEDVTLTVTGLPSGATGSFSVNPVAGGSGSSGLTVSAISGTMPTGTYTLTITAKSTSGKAHTATATLVVGTPDFAISATPGSISVRHGSKTSYTVPVSASGGFNGQVAFSVSGLPSGATGSFSPSSVTGSGSSSLRISTRNSTPRGTYPLTINGLCSSPSLQHSASVTLIVK